MTVNISHPLLWSYPVSQRFGENDVDYSKYGLKGHNGIDYACGMSTPVHAAADGTVKDVSVGGTDYGIYVTIDHGDYGTLYAHLSAPIVRPGQVVERGQMIGRSGSTGNSTGPHLHFALWIDNEPRTNGYLGYVDPQPYLDQTDTSNPTENNVSTAENIPEKGIATVGQSGVRIRTNYDENDASSAVGYWLAGKEFPYDAIINDGGDIWAQFDISGRTHYTAILNGGNWYCSVSALEAKT